MSRKQLGAGEIKKKKKHTAEYRHSVSVYGAHTKCHTLFQAMGIQQEKHSNLNFCPHRAYILLRIEYMYERCLVISSCYENTKYSKKDWKT